MGNLNVTEAICRRRTVKVLILGLSTAGKTTLLYHHVHGTFNPQFSKVMTGLYLETCQVKNRILRVWELSNGRNTSRPLWRGYYGNTQAVVFVVDGTDRDKIEEAKEILNQLLNEDELNMVPIAIALNKRDLENCMSKEELEKRLDLRSIQQQRPCEVFLTTAFPSAEVESEMTGLLEWVTGSPAKREHGLPPEQKTDRFFFYLWQPLMKMKNVMFD